jgi:D-beta-D-heptose 7-phosphate kinase/D-beta-D-heptose 1-phosphate adenosyltransferase
MRTLPDSIVSIDQAEEIVREARRAGQRIVFTNGCFDLLHPGHIHLLQQARRMGDLLIVGLNTDASIRRLKGKGRPILSEQDRAFMLAALSCVDYVVLFDTDTPIPLLERLQPDILVKGGEYRHDEVVGWEVVEGYGGRVARVPVMAGYSTTEIIRRIFYISDI